MDQPSLEAILSDLNLPSIRYFPTIDSTNTEASRWIDGGAPNLALVVADQQTSGRGRAGRRWVSSPGGGLAFSLALLSPPLDRSLLPRLTGLGALAVQQVLNKKLALSAQIKWPNDVLIDGRKVAGVLVEAFWSGDELQSAILGIGINIALESVSAQNLPPVGLDFPATCVELVTGKPVSRLELLHDILQELLSWLPRLSLPGFISACESALAYRDQWVEVSFGAVPTGAGDSRIPIPSRLGKVVGLTMDGSLTLLTASGKLIIEAVGDIHLRPMHNAQPSLPID